MCRSDRLVRQNGKAMDGWCGEITWPNGLVVELDVDRDEPNAWTMVTRCTSDPSREPKAFRGSWGNLVVESYELLQRWYATTILAICWRTAVAVTPRPVSRVLTAGLLAT